MSKNLPREPLINYRSLSAPYGLFGEARFAGNIEHIAKKRNEVQKARTVFSRVRHCCVAALANMLDITYGLRLALTDARSSE